MFYGDTKWGVRKPNFLKVVLSALAWPHHVSCLGNPKLKSVVVTIQEEITELAVSHKCGFPGKTIFT